MKMKNHKWSVKDVITTVLLSVLLIVIQLVINMICMVNDLSAWCCLWALPCCCVRLSIF